MADKVRWCRVGDLRSPKRATADEIRQ